jgi:hypothetical protein
VRIDCRGSDAEKAVGLWYVFLDGVEVTKDCYLADDEVGLVECWDRDAEGHFHIDPTNGEPVATVRYGHVEIVHAWMHMGLIKHPNWQAILSIAQAMTDPENQPPQWNDAEAGRLVAIALRGQPGKTPWR